MKPTSVAKKHDCDATLNCITEEKLNTFYIKKIRFYTNLIFNFCQLDTFHSNTVLCTIHLGIEIQPILCSKCEEKIVLFKETGTNPFGDDE